MKKSEKYLATLKTAAEYWQQKVDELPGDSISVSDPRYKMSVSASNSYAAAKTMHKYMTEEKVEETRKIQRDTYYEISDGRYANVRCFAQDETNDSEFANLFFTAVSKEICFGDCSGYETTRIVFMGRPVHYAGWQPDMLFEYKYDNNETVWGCNFPSWDH